MTTGLLLCGGSCATLSVDESMPAERGTLSLVYENDTFAGTDRNYTNGIDISYLSAPSHAPLPAL